MIPEVSDPEIVIGTWAELGSQLATIFESVHTPYALVSNDHRFVVANPAYLSMMDLTQSEVCGRSIFDVFPENPDLAEAGTAASIAESIARVVETGSTDSMPILRFDVAGSDGEFVERYWHITNIPIRDSDGNVENVLMHVEELTSFIEERLRLDGATKANTDSDVGSPLRAVGDMFTAELSRLESLSRLASALVGARTPTEVGRAVMRDGLDLVGASAGTLVMLDSEWFATVASRGVADITSQKWERFVLDAGNEPFSDSITARKAQFFENRAAFLASYPRLVEEVTAHTKHRAWVVLPLCVGDHMSGAIGLIYDQPRQFDAALRLVMFTLADLVAQAASRAQLLEEQQQALRSVEVALKPQLDPIPGVEVTHLYRPATVAAAAAAGGDWYDIVELNETSTMIVIGDVANHGAVAIGEMSRIRFIIQAFAAAGFDPAEVVRRTDELLTRTATTQATGILAVLDRRTMTLTWTTAGHPFPIVIDAGGLATVLDATHGAPLGTGLTTSYGTQQRHLGTGETLVLYTDGLIEQPGEDIDTSMQRLCDVLNELGDADDLALEVFDRLHQDGRHQDDVAVVTLHVSGADIITG